MDHRGPPLSIEDHELEQISGAIRSKDQVAHRLDAMPARRWEDVHTQQSYYETAPAPVLLGDAIGESVKRRSNSVAARDDFGVARCS